LKPEIVFPTSSSPAEPPRPGRLLAGILLALLVVAAFWPVVSGRRTFFHLDLRYEHLPVWDVTQRALRAGESPFWIDGEFCGHPVLFHQEAPVFYPLTVPLLLTGAPVARLADLFSLFHFWLAGYAAFLLLEELDTDGVSALFGSVAWMLSARLLQSAIWPNAVAVSALLPLILLGIARIARGRTVSGVILTAVTGALAILASRPHVLLGAAPLLCAGTAAFLLKARRRGKAAADLALAALLALALGAPALLPSAALYPEMSRASGLSRAERDVNPIGVGSGLDMVFLPVDGAPRWPEAAAYPGVAAGVLFVLGIGLALRGDRSLRRGLFFALLLGGAVGLVFAFGEAGPYRLVAELPLIRGFRVPARYLVSWSLAVALGSALVLSRLLSRFPSPLLAGGAAVLLLTADLSWHALRAAPTSTRALDSVEPDIVKELRSRLGRDEAGFPRRFWDLAERIALTSYPDKARVAVARRYDPLIFALGMRFGLESVDGGGPALARTKALLSNPNERVAALANAGLVVFSPPRSPGQRLPSDLVLRPAPALPRALLVSRAIPVPPDRAIAAAIHPSFDPRRAAIVEEAEALEPSGPEEPAGEVHLLARRPGRVELAATAPSERVLVLFDAWEKGWRARVDGVDTDVFRADAAFRGVRLAAGAHRVLFEYHPPGLKEGVGLFVAGLLGLALFALRVRPVPEEKAHTFAGNSP
jgi:hypothetical protein